MKTKFLSAAWLCLIVTFAFVMPNPVAAQHEFNGSYRGANLDRIAFPIGGIGAGMY